MLRKTIQVVGSFVELELESFGEIATEEIDLNGPGSVAERPAKNYKYTIVSNFGTGSFPSLCQSIADNNSVAWNCT